MIGYCSIRKVPTSASLEANGDVLLALHNVDRLEAKIDTTTIRDVVEALRYWIGETHALRKESNSRISGSDPPQQDGAAK